MKIPSESFSTIRYDLTENDTLQQEHYMLQSRACLHSDLTRDGEASCRQTELSQWD